uniref:Tax protein n=1 Tax=Echinostoma caproni TaxID=27848 RepID=A0A183BGU9_9TREM
LSSISPIPSPDASPVRLPTDWAWLLTRLQQCQSVTPDLLGPPTDHQPSTLCRLPPVGWNILMPHGGPIVSVPPGTICPASLFGLVHLDETALWRHGPITRLPVSLTYQLVLPVQSMHFFLSCSISLFFLFLSLSRLVDFRCRF